MPVNSAARFKTSSLIISVVLIHISMYERYAFIKHRLGCQRGLTLSVGGAPTKKTPKPVRGARPLDALVGRITAFATSVAHSRRPPPYGPDARCTTRPDRFKCEPLAAPGGNPRSPTLAAASRAECVAAVLGSSRVLDSWTRRVDRRPPNT